MNCIQVETGTFPKIREAFDPFVVVKLNQAGRPESDFNLELQVRLVQENSIPRYVVLDPETEAVLKTWVYQIEFRSDPKTFSKLLEEGLAVYEDRKSN